ncbi:signal transduction histidine kinase [Paraburkholderia silvatlantica]|nr:signal transduction histidine kinase [Paraburkholderia silvatlantica]PXW37237.1 signal transduction histidine kinase [Paraburkholderia silvatlantica]PYE19618.1 signal transduction histidine kinase [Paraburkholderia silvatlantica]
MSFWRSTIFRLLTMYALVFAASVVGLVGFNYWNSARYTAQQADFNINWQFEYFSALPRNVLIDEVNAHLRAEMRRPINYYGLFSRDGKHIAGDIAVLPADVKPGGAGEWFRPELSQDVRQHPTFMWTRAMVLPDGDTFIVARNVDEMTQLRNYVLGGLAWSGVVALLGGIGLGILFSAAQLRRLNEIRHLSYLIAQGDLKTRLPLRGRDELAWLSQIINRMLDEIARLMGEVKSACDGIAHDLRTPLIHIRSLLARIDAERLQQEDSQNLQQAKGAADEVLRRFAAILRISEIENLRRRGAFSDTAMHVLCREVGELYAPVAADKGVNLELDLQDTQPVRADSALMFEALANIVDNAIKFAQENGKVVIATGQAKHGPRITICDDGPGIPANERSAVLQRFYRSESTRERPGSGLGLSIVQAVMHLHEFRLTLSDANPGTCVTLDCCPGHVFI